MKSLSHALAGVAFASLVSTVLHATVSAREVPTLPPTPSFSVTDSTSGVTYDEPGDGFTWARGDHYKARFGADGARYVASFGSNWPSTAPHVLSPDVVTSGNQPLVFDTGARPTRDGDRVAFDRRAFTEVYELAPDSMEQLFYFDTLPSRGDLVLHIPIASDLEGVETERGLEFRGEHGHVAYSRAVAIDARGNRAVAATHLVDGAITIRVESEFLATATLPLVIDPVLTQFWIDSSTSVTLAPDMAWDPFHQVWVVVYEDVFSATDTDIRAKSYSSNGTLLASASIDVTVFTWNRPRIANNGSAHVFLVVAQIVAPDTNTVGRIVQPNGTLLIVDPVINNFAGGFVSGDELTPEVGGDSSPTGSTNFCVVFEYRPTQGTTEIFSRLVTPTGQLVSTNPTLLAASQTGDKSQPSISRTNNGKEWLVAYVRIGTTTSQDLWCTAVGLAGAELTDPVAIATGTTLDANPCVSSPLLYDQRSVIAFTRRQPNQQADFDVVLSVVDYSQPTSGSAVPPTVIQTVNLTFDSGFGQTPKNQTEPAIDCDGRHFLLTYNELVPAFGYTGVFATDLYLADNHLGVSQSHVEIHNGLGLTQARSRVAAARSPAAQAQRYGIIYEVRSGADDVSAVIFDTVLGGGTSSICGSTSGGVACPCGNPGANGAGCGNSAQTSGALLAVTGSPSTTTDTFRLLASGMPIGATCLFFQGTVQTTTSAFGDGRRCVGGTVVRLIVKTAAAGSAQTPAPGSGEPSISTAGLVPIGGGTRMYQTWYRDSAAFCTSATFNLTNGVLVDWAP